MQRTPSSVLIRIYRDSNKPLRRGQLHIRRSGPESDVESLNRILESSDQLIQDAANWIPGKQIAGPSFAASVLEQVPELAPDLPIMPDEQDLSRNLPAFRAAGDLFCKDQREWKIFIESEQHQEAFEEVRWATRLCSEGHHDPESKLQENMENLSKDHDKILSVIEEYRTTTKSLGSNIQESHELVKKLKSDLEEFELEKADEAVKMKWYMVMRSKELLHLASQELKSLEDDMVWFKRQIKDTVEQQNNEQPGEEHRPSEEHASEDQDNEVLSDKEIEGIQALRNYIDEEDWKELLEELRTLQGGINNQIQTNAKLWTNHQNALNDHKKESEISEAARLEATQLKGQLAKAND